MRPRAARLAREWPSEIVTVSPDPGATASAEHATARVAASVFTAPAHDICASNAATLDACRIAARTAVGLETCRGCRATTLTPLTQSFHLRTHIRVVLRS